MTQAELSALRVNDRVSYTSVTKTSRERLRCFFFFGGVSAGAGNHTGNAEEVLESDTSVCLGFHPIVWRLQEGSEERRDNGPAEQNT